MPMPMPMPISISIRNRIRIRTFVRTPDSRFPESRSAVVVVQPDVDLQLAAAAL